MSERVDSAPRVLLLDLDDWDSLASLAPALRRSGVRVARVATAANGPQLLATVLDRPVFGSEEVTVSAGAELSEEVMTPLLAQPTVDVQGSEVVVQGLRSRMNWPVAPAAARVPAEVDWQLLYDKWAMAQFAESIPVGSPESWQEAPEGVFPIVVKGRLGSGGQAVRVVHNAAERDEAVRALDPEGSGEAFFQAFSEGQITNAGGVARNGELLAWASYRAIPAPDDPLGPPERLEVVRSPGIERDLPHLMQALSYTGFFCIDYIVLPDGRALMIDFNPRVFAGWLALQRSGVDLLGAYLTVLGVGGAPVSDPAATAVGSTQFVRLLPRREVRSWSEWRAQGRHAARELRSASSVTGWGFVASSVARSARTLAAQVPGLLSRST